MKLNSHTKAKQKQTNQKNNNKNNTLSHGKITSSHQAVNDLMPDTVGVLSPFVTQSCIKRPCKPSLIYFFEAKAVHFYLTWNINEI